MKDTNLYELIHCLGMLVCLCGGYALTNFFDPGGTFFLLLPMSLGLFAATAVCSPRFKSYVNSIDVGDKSILIENSLLVFRAIYVFGFCLIGTLCLIDAYYIVAVTSFFMMFAYARDIIKG